MFVYQYSNRGHACIQIYLFTYTYGHYNNTLMVIIPVQRLAFIMRRYLDYQGLVHIEIVTATIYLSICQKRYKTDNVTYFLTTYHSYTSVVIIHR